MEMSPITISIADAVKILGIGKTQIYKAISSGKLKARRHGRRTLLEIAELHRYIGELPHDR